MSRLRPEETELVGAESGNGPNDVTARIYDLIRGHLQRLTDADGGWSVLYRDPNDDRLWELTYPHGELQGGGPPSLSEISRDAARNKYEF